MKLDELAYAEARRAWHVHGSIEKVIEVYIDALPRPPGDGKPLAVSIAEASPPAPVITVNVTSSLTEDDVQRITKTVEREIMRRRHRRGRLT